MSKHTKHLHAPQPRSLEEVAGQESTVAVVDEVESKVGARDAHYLDQSDTLVIPNQLETRQLELQKQRADLDLLIQGGGEVKDIVEAVAKLTTIDIELKGMVAKIEVAKLDLFNTELIDGIQALIANRPVTIRKLYYELVVTESEGVTSYLPIVQINDSITAFGKRSKASSGGSSGGSNGKQWSNGTTTMDSKALLGKLETEHPDVVKMLGGTNKAGANSRVIESAQRKGYLTDWHVVS